MSWTSILKCNLRYGHAQRGFYGHAQRAPRGELKADDNSRTTDYIRKGQATKESHGIQLIYIQ